MGVKTEQSNVLQREEDFRKTRSKDGKSNQTRQSGLIYLAMLTAAVTMELCDMVATRLIPHPSAPRSYTYKIVNKVGAWVKLIE